MVKSQTLKQYLFSWYNQYYIKQLPLKTTQGMARWQDKPCARFWKMDNWTLYWKNFSPALGIVQIVCNTPVTPLKLLFFLFKSVIDSRLVRKKVWILRYVFERSLLCFEKNEIYLPLFCRYLFSCFDFAPKEIEERLVMNYVNAFIYIDHLSCSINIKQSTVIPLHPLISLFKCTRFRVFVTKFRLF